MELSNYFTQFGVLESVVIRRQIKSECTEGSVTFEMAMDAAKVLGSHRLFGRDVDVAAFCESVHNFTAVENRSHTDLTITDLNDDCLIEIFRMLHPLELMAAADTCSRFRTISNMAFCRGNVCLIEVEPDIFELNGVIININEVYRFFQSYGAKVTDIDLMGSHYELLQVGELKSLFLCETLVNEKMAKNLHASTSNLETLRIESCIFEPISTSLLSQCRKLGGLILKNFDFF